MAEPHRYRLLFGPPLPGIVSLEIGGNFASMSIDAQQLFEAQLATMMTTLGWDPADRSLFEKRPSRPST